MRIGRGIGSGIGKTGGRGGKGQTARTGVRIKGFEGGQMPLHRRLPKRGFNNIISRASSTRSTSAGCRRRSTPASSTPRRRSTRRRWSKAGVLRRAKDGVRLLGAGEIKAKVAFSVYGASKSAVAAVEKAGGTVEVLGAEADSERSRRPEVGHIGRAA